MHGDARSSKCLHRNLHLLSAVALAPVDALPKLPSMILHLAPGSPPHIRPVSPVAEGHHTGCTNHGRLRAWNLSKFWMMPMDEGSLISKSMVLMIVWILM